MSTLQVQSVEQLAVLFKQAGISTTSWDGVNFKTIDDLMEEVKHGDSYICSDATHGIVRHVNLVVVMLQYQNSLLVEKHQTHLATGETRSRKLTGSLIEKLMAGENPAEGAARLLVEEMDIASSIQPSGFTEGHHQLYSPSYPGLWSCYHIHFNLCDMPEHLYQRTYQAEYEPWVTTWEWVHQSQFNDFFEEL